jgi:hypothetical protein
MAAEVVCTVCGARQPLVATLEAEAAREAWTAALSVFGESVPGTVAALARYLDWFAAPEKAPQTRTVVRVLQDLGARLAAGEVRSKGITRPAPLRAWVEGMQLIVSGRTEATRPLATNGYLAGIVFNRAEGAAAGGVSGPAAGAAIRGADRPSGALERAHLEGDLRALRTMLAGAREPSAEESLRRQIADAESRLRATGVDHGISD